MHRLEYIRKEGILYRKKYILHRDIKNYIPLLEKRFLKYKLYR